ncbi:hydrocephalus-inducing protein-like [Passer domesticus]|uniref:hydrocephalus-inducing protein-like n=1 Tax=Passer domesticus TaxID=48849 RepID=UPI0030FE7864
MASGFPKKTPTPRLLLRERLQPNTLLPSKFQQEKFAKMKKKEASTGGSILPRIGPWIDLSKTGPKLPSAPPKQNLVQISPPEVIFQNFNTHDVSEMTVSLMNVDKFPHVVKVSMERSPYFQVMGSNDAYRLLVPAVSVPVRIRFSPGENKDYSHKLVCVTERERIVVPIRAIAARAILDFPDQLDFSTCPVKCSTQKTLLLRNTGNLEARFQLSTQRQSLFGQSQRELQQQKLMEEKETGKEKGSCEDRAASLRASGEMAKVHQDPMFSDDVSVIEPMEGEIEPDGLAKIKMTFKPLEAVEYQSVAYCSISGRESRLPLQLRGEGQGPLVELSCDTLELGDIFVNTPHVCEVKLINQGALDAPFRYIPAATKVGLGFKLAPQEGIIAAGGSQTLQISFSATVLGRFEEELRFSVAGSPTPAILTIRGSVTGPSLHFDLPELDFGDISFGECCLGWDTAGGICAFREKSIPPSCSAPAASSGWELQAAGAAGSIWPLSDQTEARQRKSGFSGVSVLLEKTDVCQGRRGSSWNGKMSPCLQMMIPLKLQGSNDGERNNSSFLDYIRRAQRTRADVCQPPSAIFVLWCSFPYTQRCRLTNSSPVPVTFQLRMSFDGTQPAVDSVDQIRCHSDPAWRKGVHLYVEPREFTITPSRGTILPQGHQDIQVTLCSNSVMEFYRKMLVDLEGFGKGVASLVITARCLVPKLQVSPHVLQYDECLLKVPYEKKFLIRNPSHLPGCYGLIEQKRKEDSAVLYSSPKPCGIVQPHSTAEIPVLVEVQALGAHRTNVLIGVFGDERNPLRKQLWSSGRQAESSPSPRLVESGRIPALQPIDELHPPKFNPQPPKEMRTCLDCPASRWRHFKAGKQEAATALTEEQDLTQSSGAEASSILPVSGVLQPGESQQVSLPFSGHLNSISSATALCHVEGGPSSEVLVPGEASRVSCSPSPQEINCGSEAPLRER